MASPKVKTNRSKASISTSEAFILPFTIPSLHDNNDLECRVYHPNGGVLKGGAIFAHPYAPLGGSFDDAVVQSITSTLVSRGYTVGTFNFRGAGSSQGRTSWSGMAEVLDYISFAGFLVTYLQLPNVSLPFISPTSSSIKESEDRRHALSLILGGYSYGSMITTLLPPFENILNRFNNSIAGSTEEQIEIKADGVRKEYLQHIQSKDRPRQTSGLEKIGQFASSSIQEGANSRCFVQASYLLVSPILPPLSWVIANPIYWTFHRQIESHKTMVANQEQIVEKLTRCRTLAVYSDNDQFTSASKLRKWSSHLQKVPGSLFQMSEIPRTGHFWIAEGALDRLEAAVRDWLSTTPTDV